MSFNLLAIDRPDGFRRAALRAGLAGFVLLASVATVYAATEDAPLPIPAPRAGIVAPTPSAPGAPILPASLPTGKPVADRAAVLQNISSYFNSIRTMEGQFIQIGPNGEQSEGTFYLARPGKVRFRYKPPVRVDIVADGKSLSVEDKSVGTQDLYPLSKTPLKSLLADNIDLTSTDIVGEVREDGDLISLVLAEKTFGDGSLTLIFDKNTFELKQWVITDAQGLNTSVALYNVATGQPLDPSLFKIFIIRNSFNR